VRFGFLLFVLLALCFGTGAQAAPRSVYLEDLTWTELRDALKAGVTTVIIPVGGTEQSGPHIALGKHNTRVKALAGGSPPSWATRWSRRLSPMCRKATFRRHRAYALSRHDLDSRAGLQEHDRGGGPQPAAGRLHPHRAFRRSRRLSAVLETGRGAAQRDWAGTPVRAHFIEDYYRATETAYVQALRAKDLSDAQIGSHAGTADTSLQMAIDPSAVRAERLEGAQGRGSGTSGDPRPSTAALGQLGVDLIVAQTVAAIRKARMEKH